METTVMRITTQYNSDKLNKEMAEREGKILQLVRNFYKSCQDYLIRGYMENNSMGCID
jgi:hypothetical protein